MNRDSFTRSNGYLGNHRHSYGRPDILIRYWKVTPRVIGWALALFLVAPIWAGGCRNKSPESVESGRSNGYRQNRTALVEFEIRYGEVADDRNFDAGIYPGETIFEVMSHAREDGLMEFNFQGSGMNLFVNSIDGLQNQGNSGDNWIFRHNGKVGTESCDLVELKAGDVVNWTFGEYKLAD